MIPLITTVNSKNQEIAAIVYYPTDESPWVFLEAGTQVVVDIPPTAQIVRFGYAQSGGNVYSSYKAITLPTLGVPIGSAAETNAEQRDISGLKSQGITTLNLLSDVDTNVHVYFYTL